MFFCKDDVLYRHVIVAGHPVHRLVLPNIFHELVFTGLHDDAGHQGRERTSRLLKSRFFWPGIDHCVGSSRVRTCSRCIRRKTSAKVAAWLFPLGSSFPLVFVFMDFLT